MERAAAAPDGKPAFDPSQAAAAEKEKDDKLAEQAEELAKSKLADAEVANEKDVAANRFGDLGRRNKVARLFQAVETTKLLAESNWWHRRIEQVTADVVAPNRFWADYATAPAGQPFVSSAIVAVTWVRASQPWRSATASASASSSLARATTPASPATPSTTSASTKTSTSATSNARSPSSPR